MPLSWSYRQEPGRLVLRIEGMDPRDRLLLSEQEHLNLDLGRVRVRIPDALDWDATGKYYPPRVLFDPQGRPWQVIDGTDTGNTVELSTPFPPLRPVWPATDQHQ